MKKTIALFLTIALLLVFGGTAAAADTTAPATQTVTDMQGRTQEIPYEINKIVCMGPSALRIVCYLGAQDLVVGIENSEDDSVLLRPYNYVNQHLRDLPIVSEASKSGLVPYEEEILKVEPDVILMAFSQVETGEALQDKLGIPVVFVNTNGAIFQDQWFDSLNLIASILHKEDRAAEIVNYTNGILADLGERTASITDTPTVYLGAASARGAHGIDGTIAAYPPFVAVNIQNVADELATEGVYGVNSTVELEKILDWNADIMFLNVENMSLVNNFYAENPEFFTNLNAFNNGKIYAQVAYNNYGGNLELAVLNAYYAGMMVYPEAFEDVNLDAVAKTAFETLLGQDMTQDLKDAGMWFASLTIG